MAAAPANNAMRQECTECTDLDSDSHASSPEEVVTPVKGKKRPHDACLALSDEKPNALFQPIHYNSEQLTKHIRVFTVETGSIPEGADKFYSSFSLAPECYLTAPDLKDVPNKHWLRFGKDEKWVKNLIIAVTGPKNVRDVCENFKFNKF